MTTDNDIARVCASSYDSTTTWDKLWQGADSGDIYVGETHDTICFRGSVTQEDWFRDFDALSVDDPILGGLHAGFAQGIHEFFTKNLQLLRPNSIICGHSLGAARALIMGAYMEQAGLRPRAVIVFGAPRPGFARLAEILQPVTVRSYKNRFDPVTDVPVPFFPSLPYVHPRQSININVKPPLEDLELLADHHIELYVSGTPATEI